MCPKKEFPVKNEKITLALASMVVTISNFSAREPTDTTVFQCLFFF